MKLSSDITNNFGNSIYRGMEIKDPIIVYDIVDAIKLYKKYLENRK